MGDVDVLVGSVPRVHVAPARRHPLLDRGPGPGLAGHRYAELPGQVAVGLADVAAGSVDGGGAETEVVVVRQAERLLVRAGHHRPEGQAGPGPVQGVGQQVAVVVVGVLQVKFAAAGGPTDHFAVGPGDQLGGLALAGQVPHLELAVGAGRQGRDLGGERAGADVHDVGGEAQAPQGGVGQPGHVEVVQPDRLVGVAGRRQGQGDRDREAEGAGRDGRDAAGGEGVGRLGPQPGQLEAACHPGHGEPARRRQRRPRRPGHEPHFAVEPGVRVVGIGIGHHDGVRAGHRRGHRGGLAVGAEPVGGGCQSSIRSVHVQVESLIGVERPARSGHRALHRDQERGEGLRSGRRHPERVLVAADGTDQGHRVVHDGRRPQAAREGHDRPGRIQVSQRLRRHQAGRRHWRSGGEAARRRHRNAAGQG